MIESRRRHYHTVKPHGSLGYKRQAPEMFIPALAARASQPRPAAPLALTQNLRSANIRTGPVRGD